MKQHTLEVYEPYEYLGQNPLTIEGVAVMEGPSREDYYLLRVFSPFDVDKEKVELLLISPRYNGDKIDRAVSSTCTVNIARVPPGTELDSDHPLDFSCLHRWGVGKITPSENH